MALCTLEGYRNDKAAVVINGTFDAYGKSTWTFHSLAKVYRTKHIMLMPMVCLPLYYSIYHCKTRSMYDI